MQPLLPFSLVPRGSTITISGCCCRSDETNCFASIEDFEPAYKKNDKTNHDELLLTTHVAAPRSPNTIGKGVATIDETKRAYKSFIRDRSKSV